MKIRRRLAAAGLALTLGMGGAIAVPAAASAAQNLRFSDSGIQTKALCEYAKGSNIRHIIARGGTIHGGESCYYGGSRTKWAYSFLYRL